MSDVWFFVIYILVSFIFLIPSLWFFISWDGVRFTVFKFLIALGYNSILISLHFRYAESGVLPFWVMERNEVLGWFSFVISFVYAYLIPIGSGGRGGNKFWR